MITLHEHVTIALEEYDRKVPLSTFPKRLALFWGEKKRVSYDDIGMFYKNQEKNMQYHPVDFTDTLLSPFQDKHCLLATSNHVGVNIHHGKLPMILKRIEIGVGYDNIAFGPSLTPEAEENGSWFGFRPTKS